MPELKRFFTAATHSDAPLHKIELKSLWPEWRNRTINKKSNQDDLLNAGFGAVIIGVSTGSNDPNSVTTGEELDASIHKAFFAGANQIIVCNNYAPHQFDTKRMMGVTDEEAFQMVRKRGEKWLETNSQIFSHYADQAKKSDVRFGVKDWEEIRHDRRYPGFLSALNRLYSENGANGEPNFASVVKAYIRSYIGRFIVNKVTDKEAQYLLKDPSELSKLKRMAEIHVEEETAFIDRKRENHDIYFGRFYTPSVDVLDYLAKPVIKDLVNSAIEKITGYAIMSDDLVADISADKMVAYIHHGGILYWDEFFHSPKGEALVQENELGAGLSKIAFFTANKRRMGGAPSPQMSIEPPTPQLPQVA